MTKEVQVEYLLHRIDSPDDSDLTDPPASTEYFKFAYAKKYENSGISLLILI